MDKFDEYAKLLLQYNRVHRLSGAKDLHELMRAWENYHRMWTGEAHLRHILFREESRYPGFYYRSDFLDLDEDNWKCFVNSKVDPKTGEWEMIKRPHMDLVEKVYK